jgi:hypothetical protein
MKTSVVTKPAVAVIPEGAKARAETAIKPIAGPPAGAVPTRQQVKPAISPQFAPVKPPPSTVKPALAQPGG